MLDSALSSLSFDLPVIALSVGLTVVLVGFVAFLFADKEERKSLIILIFGLSTLGAVAGVAGGSSRVGVVGDVIPAALALAGGVSAYLFGVDRSKGLVASFCAAAFALSLGLGYATGAGNRSVTDNKAENLAFCRALYQQIDIWQDDRAFCRAATIFGEQCNWFIADSMSQVPETSKFKTQANKFTYVFGQLESDMQARLQQTPNCVAP
ncbi:MAG: hypothetical protein ABJO27_14405 [Pseudoruegeria sp.]